MDPDRSPTAEQKERFQQKLSREVHIQQKRKRRQLRSIHRKKRRRKIVRTAASIAAVLVASTFMILYNTVEGFAASVDNFLSVVTPEAQELRITEKTGGDIEMNASEFEGMYLPSWLPDGYEISEVEIEDSWRTIFYRDQDGNLITFYILANANSIILDNEEVVSSICYIHGIPARIIEKEEKTRIVWEDSGYAYAIIGNTEIQEDLITMAKETAIVQEGDE